VQFHARRVRHTEETTSQSDRSEQSATTRREKRGGRLALYQCACARLSRRQQATHDKTNWLAGPDPNFRTSAIREGRSPGAFSQLSSERRQRVAGARCQISLRPIPKARKFLSVFIIIDTNGYYVHDYGRSLRLIIMETLPIPVKNAMRKFGSDIRDARLRRRIPVAVMAQRAFISRTTLVKLEKGDPGVAMGTYAAVLFALGMIDKLRELASAKSDEIGLALDEERLPKRIEIRPRRAAKAPTRK
jgi:DNA-binding XRE family transcriptional regulator